MTSLILLLAGVSAVSLASAAAAQEASTSAVEEVVVTGSRIRQTGNEAPTPVTVTSTEQLQKASPGSIPEALVQLPQFAGSLNRSQQQHIGPRRGAAQRLEKTSQRRAAVEVVQRQATGGQVRDLGRQGLDAGRQVNRGEFMWRRCRVSRVHHQRVQPLLGKRRAKPLHHHTGIADLRVVDQRHEAQPAGGSLRRCQLATVAPRHRARDRAGPALVPHQLAQTFGLVTE